MPSSKDERLRHLAVENAIDRASELARQEYHLSELYEQGGDPDFLTLLNIKLRAVAETLNGRLEYVTGRAELSTARAELWKFLEPYEEALDA